MKENRHIENIIIGLPLVEWWDICCSGERNELGMPSVAEITLEQEKTLFTAERNLAKILKSIGAVKSISEVRRNRPELCKDVENPDCFWLKWGKQRFWVVVGRRLGEGDGGNG